MTDEIRPLRSKPPAGVGECYRDLIANNTGQGDQCSRLLLTLPLGFIYRVPELFDRGDLRKVVQCVLGHVAPNRWSIERMIDSPHVDLKAILRRSHFVINTWPSVRCGSTRPGSGKSGGSLLSSIGNATGVIVRAVVCGGIADRRTIRMSPAYRDNQVRSLFIPDHLESAPFRYCVFHVSLRGSICIWTRQRLACLRTNHNCNGLRPQHIFGEPLLFLVFCARLGNQQKKNEESNGP